MTNLVNQILSVFQQFRMAELPIDQYEALGKALLAEKIRKQVARKQPLSFVMLGLPFKSTNTRDKVLGDKPDMAEYATMRQLARFNTKMKQVYPKGVVVKIISDGFVFNDVLNVTDRTVWTYKEICEQMALEVGAPLELIDATQFYSKRKTLSAIRDDIMMNFGISEAELQHRILFDPNVNILYRGMIRFMGQELAMKEYSSNNQLHKAAKKLARTMMFRNEAYSQMVRQEFSDDIRLSMHQSTNNGKKYSFQLINSPNARHSAWHSAVVLDVDGSVIQTIHKKDAQAAKMELISMDGRDSHYVKT